MANFVAHQFLHAKNNNLKVQPYMRMIFHDISFTLSMHGIATDLKTCASWSKLRETVRGVRNSIEYLKIMYLVKQQQWKQKKKEALLNFN